MKGIGLVLMMIMLSVSVLGEEFKTITYDLTDLYYDNDLISTGVDQNYNFYFPVVNADAVESGKILVFYEYAQIAGPRSMLVFSIDDVPVQTVFLEQSKGQMSFSIPSEFLQLNSLVKLSLAITLDYSLCDDSRINKDALWFRIKKESRLEYAYLEQSIETISAFLSPMNPDRFFELVYEGSDEQFVLLTQMAQYLGYLSRGVKRQLNVVNTPTGLHNSIEISSDSSRVQLANDGSKLSIGKDISEVFPFINVIPTDSLLVEQGSVKERNDHTLSFSDLNINTIRTDVVYNNQVSFPLTLDRFGGVPEEVWLDLKFSFFNKLREEGYSLNIFLNDDLLQSINVSQFDHEQRMNLKIAVPSDYFRAFNTLSFEMVNQKSECDEFSVIIYDDSTFSFTDSRPYLNPLINEFPYSVYARTLYVVSNFSDDTAKAIVKLAYEKGRIASMYLSPQVITMEEFAQDETALSQYDSLVFLIDSADFFPLTQLVQLTDSFSISDDEGGMIFEAMTSDAFDVVYSFNYKGLPAVAFSGFSKSFGPVDSRFFIKTSQAASNFALFSESGIFAFDVGEEKLSVESERKDQEQTKSFWMQNRLWIVVLIVVVILYILISSYNKTSKGR